MNHAEGVAHHGSEITEPVVLIARCRAPQITEEIHDSHEGSTRDFYQSSEHGYEGVINPFEGRLGGVYDFVKVHDDDRSSGAHSGYDTRNGGRNTQDSRHSWSGGRYDCHAQTDERRSQSTYRRRGRNNRPRGEGFFQCVTQRTALVRGLL